MTVLVKRTLTSAMMLGATTAALAHASWIGQHAGDFVVIYGDGSVTNEAYDPAVVTDAKGFDKTGAAVVSVLYSDGCRAEDAKGEWHNEPAAAYPDFKATGQYFTYPVAYVRPTDAQNPVGHKLEIVPLADPTKLSVGDKLQVLLNGAPVKGVVIINDVLTDWDISSPLTCHEDKTMV